MLERFWNTSRFGHSINDLLCELIADIAETKQISGIEVIKQAKEGAAGTYSDNDIDE